MDGWPERTSDPGAEGGGDPGAGQTVETALEMQYQQVLDLMQQGRWQEADVELTEIERHQPNLARTAELREALALRVAAEENWSGRFGRRVSRSLTRVIRALAIANLLLYSIVIVMWLLKDRVGW